MSKARPSKPPASRWFPSGASQLEGHTALERSFRQVLQQHYALVDRVNEMQAATVAQAKGAAGAKSGPFPPGCGPADTYVLGLPVTPVDVQGLADGMTLKYVAAQRCFTFK